MSNYPGFTRLHPDNIVVMNIGGGTDSIGCTVLAIEACIIPDALIWADTGDERPLRNGMPRAEYLDIFDEWLARNGAPKLTRVRWIRKDGTFESLSDHCLRLHDLPSKVYDNAGCTSKWKQQPCDNWVRAHFGNGSNVERWLGFTAEDGRADRMYAKMRAADTPQLSLLDVGGKHKPSRDNWIWRAPPWEADVYRQDAVEAIVRAGLPPADKSACFECPSSKPHEIIELRTTAPHMLDKALLIERNAELKAIVGLGRNWSWNELIKNHDTGGPLFEGVGVEASCYCEDG